MISIHELKQLLTQLHYEEIEFFGYGDYQQILYFDALIDTYYRVMCVLKSNTKVEVHDTTFDVDNYVLIAIAHRKQDDWIITYK